MSRDARDVARDVDERAFLIVRVGERVFAFPIDTVREVRLPVPLLRIPDAPSFSDGVLRVKRLHVPVLDLRRRLGAAPEDHDAGERLVLVAVGGLVIGLVVDEVQRVVRAAADPTSGEIPYRARPEAVLAHARVVAPEELLSDAERAELASRRALATAPESTPR